MEPFESVTDPRPAGSDTTSGVGLAFGVVSGFCSGSEGLPPQLLRRWFKQCWKLSKDYSLAMLGKMPDQYLSFRPVPEGWTLSQQLTHLADANILMPAPLRSEKPDYVGDPRQLGRPELEKTSSIRLAIVEFDVVGEDHISLGTGIIQYL
jgi:hypothetical protein